MGTPAAPVRRGPGGVRAVDGWADGDRAGRLRVSVEVADGPAHLAEQGRELVALARVEAAEAEVVVGDRLGGVGEPVQTVLGDLHECRAAVGIPIIGMGGVATPRDVVEFLIAGATAVQVGTANFEDPGIWTKLRDGLEAYLERHSHTAVTDIIGTVQLGGHDAAWISS